MVVYPARDERVMRVIRKIIRGLCHHHQIDSAVSDDRVWADVLKYQIPEELFDSVSLKHCEPDIVEYWYEFYDADGSSVWFLRFFERCSFVARVHPAQ